MTVLLSLTENVRETYGPFTRSYSRPEYMKITLEERARFYARQGHAFATADEARVVYQGENQTELRDVPADGMTVGEIVTRGNIVMKEVSVCDHYFYIFQNDFVSVLPRSRNDKEGL